MTSPPESSTPATRSSAHHPVVHGAGVATQARLARAEDLLSLRRLPEALAAFADPDLTAVQPDACAAGRWQCHMLLGDLASAWTESDGLRQRGSPDPHRFWDGSPLNGKRVILRCLHGLGDATQFLRYAPELGRLAQRLIVEVPPPLLDLAPFLVGPHEIVTWGTDTPSQAPAWDAQIEVMELPYIFRSTLADLPAPDAALDLPKLLRAGGQTSPSHRPRVGIVWSGGSWNPSRSVPFSCLAPLLATAGPIDLFSLQPSSANAEWMAATGRYALQPPGVSPDTSPGTSLDRLLPLATFIAGLDLVITVDTLAAHLAGALGRPTWILLQFEADWRWLHGRVDSPWYPSARLFRQTASGDWASLIGRVREELLIWYDHFHHQEVPHAPLG